MTMREIRQTSRFKKDYKAALKRGLPKDELRAVIEALANDEPLPERCRPHMLSGNWSGHWECHIRADWLLIYKITTRSWSSRSFVLERTAIFSTSSAGPS